jgi:two-component system OmpR family response regulator
LLVEDDPRLQRMIARGLTDEGYEVVGAADGETGLDHLVSGGVDACVLDVLLPGIDGFEVLTRARSAGVATPILMLTALDTVPDRVRGLNLGADDYLVKPFAFAELLARLSALLRRGPLPSGKVLRHGALALDAAAHRLTVDGAEVALSHKQFALLELLLRRRGEVVSRAAILETVFGYRFDPGTNLVDVHVANLRQRIDRPGRVSLIEAVRGVGYRLRGSDDEP